jgi:asparagine synthase (glutamine-hydrolysing)
LLRRVLHLESELDLLLDKNWLNEGLERLSTLADSISPPRAAGTIVHAQVAALKSCWYMRNQLLRDTDWSGMAFGLEVRVPFVDIGMLDRLGPAIASSSPTDKQDLAHCAQRLPRAMVARRKTGFTTPVRTWIARSAGPSSRGLRGWAAQVHRLFRNTARLLPQLTGAAA